jgi:REP element-mobilizing transposase RayT
MARPLRIQYPGAMYHVMNRGDQREDIFHDDEDRQRFLGTLTEACVKTEWQIHAYCLMRNQFHLVVETPQVNLVFGMKWLLGTYTKRFNIRHKICGHLFAGRYKALVVEGSGDGYLRTVCDYEPLRKDWVLGTEQFRKELLAAVTERIGPSHFGEQRQETAEQKAERLLKAELEKVGWKQASLSMVSKGHPVKVRLARLLRTESTMSLKWIAARLQMGSWTYVSNLLHAKPNPQRLNQDLLPLCQ